MLFGTVYKILLNPTNFMKTFIENLAILMKNNLIYRIASHNLGYKKMPRFFSRQIVS